MVPRQRRALLALGFYTVAAALISAPLPYHLFSTVARAVRQDVWLNVWALAWTSEHLLTAPAGLFDANIFFPHLRTLAYTDHFIGQALLAAPIYTVSGNAALAYNVAWFAALVLTAWGGYLWVRTLIGDEPAGEAAALVAGAVCLLVPGKRTALSHLQVISLQGVTLTLYAFHLLLRKASGRRALALTAALVYAGLSSWYTAVYTGLMVLFVAGAGLLIGDPGARRTRTVAFGALAIALATTIMYPVALPYRAVQAEMAFERPMSELVATSLSPMDFVSSWSWLHEAWMPSGSGAGGYFPGFVALALALIGIWQGLRRADRWPMVYAVGAALFALLALGPRLAVSDSLSFPLPYELLFRWVPGVDALRNPYRAAFIGSILLAAPVGYGARAVIERLRGRVLYRQRWIAHPRLYALPVATWALAVLLAGAHLAEAWSGPQEIADLPAAPSAAYEWLAREHPGEAALVVPLPRPFDDNARYQLWTVGHWVPLVNGHSGLYPPDFLALYRAGAEFPEPRFVQVVKESFPVRFVVAHYALDPDGSRTRAAASIAGLRQVWAEGEDVVYELSNGAAGGWARRRIPTRKLGESIAIRSAGVAAGCGLRVLADGAVVGTVDPSGVPDGSDGTYEMALGGVGVDVPAVTFELFYVGDDGLPRIDLAASMRPQRRSTLELNGVLQLEGPVVVAVVDVESGRLLFGEATTADDAGAGAALRRALEAASPGDELLVAVAEDLDYGLIERLRLLLERAGGAAREETLQDVGTTFVFRGRMGGPAGSARVRAGDDQAQLGGGVVGESDAEAGDCRLAHIEGFEMRANALRR